MRVASWPMAAEGIWRSISTVAVDSYTGVRRAEMMMVDATQLRTKPRIFQRWRRGTNPKVGEGDGRLIGRLGVVTVPRGLGGLVGGWKGFLFRHVVLRG